MITNRLTHGATTSTGIPVGWELTLGIFVHNHDVKGIL